MTFLPSLPKKVPSEVPLGCSVLCVGEAPGKTEDSFGRPFIGGSGQLLRWALQKVGFQPEQIGYTNVLPWRPPENRLADFCIPRANLRLHEAPDWYKALPVTVPGKIIHPSLGVPALQELYELIDGLAPSIIIALGNTACWALIHQTGIERLRGSPLWDNPLQSPDSRPAHKVLPTYHPAAIIRNYKLLPVFLLDLLKALNESQTYGIVYPHRWLEILPTVERCRHWFEVMQKPSGTKLPVLHGSQSQGCIGRYIACDVETSLKPGPSISMIGFAPAPHLGLVIPFFNPANEDRCHFSKEEEREVILLLKGFMESAAVAKVWHNCLYDLPWVHSYGINPQNASHDTMLMAHSLWPEMRKSLRLLASILTQERNWKWLRTRSNKRDDT